MPDELKIQKAIEEWAIDKGLYLFDITWTKASGGLLRLSFIHPILRNEFLEFMRYQELADKSGVIVCQDEYTVLLRGIALGIFFRKL